LADCAGIIGENAIGSEPRRIEGQVLTGPEVATARHALSVLTLERGVAPGCCPSSDTFASNLGHLGRIRHGAAGNYPFDKTHAIGGLSSATGRRKGGGRL
jgi:hypothetical protein